MVVGGALALRDVLWCSFLALYNVPFLDGGRYGSEDGCCESAGHRRVHWASRFTFPKAYILARYFANAFEMGVLEDGRQENTI